jgi:hypothetical protein
MCVKSVEQVSKALAPHNRFVERSFHKTTHTVMYIFNDKVTDEVIAGCSVTAPLSDYS